MPLSRLYGLAVYVRNKLFDWNVLKSREFDVPVISVGNIAVGGTGKTPHAEYIVNILKDTYNIGFLSRGYKRHTHGFVLANERSTPADIGDEAYQVYHKFGKRVMVAVCENRVHGIEKMLEINPSLNLIVLDDALQHRYVKPKVSVLLTEYNQPFFQDDLLPYGRLRESADAVNRADIVIATKCPSTIQPIDFRIFEKRVNLIPAQDLFFTRLRYDVPQPIFPEAAKTRPMPALDRLTPENYLLALSGIGNPRPFVRYVKSFKARVKVNVFPDHHAYTRKDMDLIRTRFDSLPKGRGYILTTEKDAVRLMNNPYFPHELKPYIYYIPIRIAFMRDEAARFNEVLRKFINRHTI